MSHPRRPLTFLVLGGLSAFGPLATDLYLPALPAVSRDLSAGQSLTQLTISASLVGLALGQLVAGPVSDNLGRKRPLLVGLAAFVVLSGACAFAPDVWTLVVARLLQGAAGAAGLVIARAMVRDLYGPAGAARVFAELTLVSGLAPIVAPLIGAQLLRVMDWRGLFLVLGGIGVVLLIGAVTLPESLPAGRRRSDGLRDTFVVVADLLRSRPLLGYTLAAGFSTAALLTYISASPFVLQDGYHLSTQTFSIVFAVNSAGIIVFGQTGGQLVRHVGSFRLLVSGLVVQAAAGAAVLVVGLSGTPALPALLVPLFLVVAGVGLVGPHATALALAPHPDVTGSASAIVGTSQFLLAGLLSPLGSIGGNASVVPMGAAIAAMTAAGLTACLVLTGHRSDPPDSPV